MQQQAWQPPQGWLQEVVGIAQRAAEVVMAVYQTDFEVRGKGDASPVTEADERAEAIIAPALAALEPSLPVVAEEAVAAGVTPDHGERFWLVDPLDGTKEFVSRNGEFTVNIALIERGEPVLGVVIAPALGRAYIGQRGAGAWVQDEKGRRELRCRQPPDEGLTVVASRSHADPEALAKLLQGTKVARLVNAGSSLKLCLVASGEADVYPRQGRTMEWDIAAGHAVLAAAGGEVVRLDDGKPLRYGKPGLDNPHFLARKCGGGQEPGRA